jgi:hypothetical protein
MDGKNYFATVDIALTGVFCALWIVLNLALGPLSFQLLGLPIIHDFAVFFTLLLVVWVTGRFGTSLLVGIIGSAVAILLGPPPMVGPMICFAASAIVFDLLMSANHHKIPTSIYSFTVASIATIVSAFFAGVLIGVLFTSDPSFQTALTFWGGWHIIGGIMTLAITLPIVAALEKANVRRLIGDRH